MNLEEYKIELQKLSQADLLPHNSQGAWYALALLFVRIIAYAVYYRMRS